MASRTLGGGYGWLTGRHGLTIDEVRAVKMVLSDGRIVTASSDENQDLFWAVRGAGHCFGIAVEFTFQLHPQDNPIWSGQMVFPASQALTAVVNFGNNLVATTDGSSAMVMGITQPPFMQEAAVVATVFHDGPEDAARAIFKPLLDLNPRINTTKVRPYVEQNTLMNGPVDYGNRKLSKGVPFTLPLSPDFAHSLLSELKTLHSQVAGSTKSIMLFEFFHMGKVLKPWQDMAHAIRGEHGQVMIGPFWLKAQDDATVRSWTASTATVIRGELERVNGKEVADTIGEYGNYDGECSGLSVTISEADIPSKGSWWILNASLAGTCRDLQSSSKSTTQRTFSTGDTSSWLRHKQVKVWLRVDRLIDSARMRNGTQEQSTLHIDVRIKSGSVKLVKVKGDAMWRRDLARYASTSV